MAFNLECNFFFPESKLKCTTNDNFDNEDPDVEKKQLNDESLNFDLKYSMKNGPPTIFDDTLFDNQASHSYSVTLNSGMNY